MPDVGRGLAVAMQLQIVGEKVEEGLEQRPLRVEDETPVSVAKQPDVLNVKYVAAGRRPGKKRGLRSDKQGTYIWQTWAPRWVFCGGSVSLIWKTSTSGRLEGRG